MEIQESKDKESFGGKRNSLIQLWISLKNSIFDVLFVLLGNTSQNTQDETLISIINQSGIDYIQMMQFPFTQNILMVWNGGDTLTNIFNFLTNILQINALMPSLNYTVFIGFLYFVIFLILLVILDIIYVSYSFNKKKFRFTLPLVLLAHIVPYFVTFLFIPITQLLLNIVNCQPSKDDPSKQVLNFFPDIVCFEGYHIAHTVITLFFTSLFIFISTIVAMTLFEPRMTSNSITARKNSKGQVIFIANKVICQFIFSFSPFQQTWVYVAFMFFPALWLFYCYNFEQPYYNKPVSKLFRIFSAYYFWTVLILSVSQAIILMGIEFEGSMVIWFCGLPFLGFIIAYENKSNIDNLFSSNLKFKTGDELQSHLQYVLQLLNERKKDENSSMLLVGYIQKHIEVCMEDDCPIKVKKPKKQDKLSEMQQNCKLLYIQIERMYKQGIKKFPNSTKLHISFAFFYMQRLKQNAKAYEQFMMAQKCSPSFIQEFILYRFKKIIKQKLQQNQDEESDLIEIIRFDNHISLCQEAMVQSAKLHKQFWTQLLQEIPNLEKLNQTGSNIISIVKIVKQNFQEVNKINSHSPQIIHNYGIYSMFVSQNLNDGKRYLSQAKRAFYQKKTKQQLMIVNNNSNESDINNCSIIVSGSQLTLGKIVAVNNNFIEMSGYLKQQITQKSIDKILPQIFLIYHEYSMNLWLTDTTKTYINQNNNKYLKQQHKGFIKQKNGFIIPITYKLNYSIFQEKFYVFFKNQKEYNQNLQYKMHIITDSKGIIKEISSLGFSYFNFSKDNLSSNQRYIDQLGINFSSDVYYNQPTITDIYKKMFYKALNTVQSSHSDHQHQRSLQLQYQEKDQFLISAQKIYMKILQQEQQNESSIQNKQGKKHIGSIYILQKLNRQKIKPKQIKFETINTLNQFTQDILNFYQLGQSNNESFQGSIQDQGAPMINKSYNESSMLNQAVNEIIMRQKQKQVEKVFYNYGQKIKTYRLMNKQLKRIYIVYQGSQNSDFDEMNEQNIDLNAFEIGKIKDPAYAQKIKNAINTNVNHSQVKLLKIIIGIFTIILTTLSVISFISAKNIYNQLNGYLDDDLLWARDQNYISSILYLSISQQKQINFPEIYDNGTLNILNYKIQFDPDIQIILRHQDNSTSEIQLKGALMWLQGSLIQYFNQQHKIFQNLVTLLENYYKFIQPSFQNYQTIFNISYTGLILCFVFILAIAVVTFIIWVYNIMMIDRKCSDIILWFLDISLSYIKFLQNNCNTFIKSHINVKELIEKGINFNDKNLYIQQFKMDSDDNDEYNQENKSRKIMIARHKKKSLLSRCSCSYALMVWIIIYSAILSTINISMVTNKVQIVKQINQIWTYTTKQLIWSNTIPNNLRLINSYNYTHIGNFDLIAFQQKLQQNFFNPSLKYPIKKYKSILMSLGARIYNTYHDLYERNICQSESYPEEIEINCKEYLDGKLQGGIQAIFNYYSKIEKQKTQQVQNAQFEFVNKKILYILQTWHNEIQMRINTSINISIIILIFYIMITVVGFIIFWFVYIRKLNRKLNETIQMLNMIPLNMLPKNRKDIRDFFFQIIRQANKCKIQQN